MRKPELIRHGDKVIIYLDFSQMRNQDEIIALELEGSKLIRECGQNKALTLTNMEGMHFNNEIRAKFSEIVKEHAPCVKAGAVIGLSGLISIMYSGFMKMTGRNIKSFQSKDEAISYLLSA